MHNNKNGPRRSSRLSLAVLPLASALVSACQSFGPEQPAAPLPLVVAPAPVPLEPIVLPSLEYREPVVEPDLFVRLRSRFTFEIPADAAVERERAWYARNQSYLDRVFARGDLYLFHITQALEERG